MRVGIDVQLATGTSTGIGEYATGLAAALAAAGVDVVRLRAPWLDPWRFDRRVLWDQVGLPLAAARARVDVLHCASGTVPLAASARIVATAHDVAWLRVQAHARPYARAYFGAFALARYRAARAILVDSEYSRGELLAVAPDIDPARVSVAYPGVARDVAAIVRERDDDAPFALVVGTVEARKNLALVVRMLAALPQMRAVSVGPPTPYVRECEDLARALGVADRLELRGYVPRAELLGLYARATLALAPSRYEGFGYAAAQALCVGVPLVASNATSLPEIVAGAAPCLDPDDVDAWVAATRDVLADPASADARVRAVRAESATRFGWAQCARAAADAYARALSGDV